MVSGQRNCVINVIKRRRRVVSEPTRELILKFPKEDAFKFLRAFLKIIDTGGEKAYIDVMIEGREIGLPIKVGRPEEALADVFIGLVTVRDLKLEDFPEDLLAWAREMYADNTIQREIEALRNER